MCVDEGRGGGGGDEAAWEEDNAAAEAMREAPADPMANGTLVHGMRWLMVPRPTLHSALSASRSMRISRDASSPFCFNALTTTVLEDGDEVGATEGPNVGLNVGASVV